jgi:hypothetical protein
MNRRTVSAVFATALLATGLAIPASASARVAIHGDDKVAVVQAYYGWLGGRLPNAWLIEHCTSVWGTRPWGNAPIGAAGRWFNYYYSGGDRRACLPIGSDGFAIVFLNSRGHLIGDVGGDEPELQSCAAIANDHYRGTPRPSVAIVRDLLGDCLR